MWLRKKKKRALGHVDLTGGAQRTEYSHAWYRMWLFTFIMPIGKVFILLFSKCIEGRNTRVRFPHRNVREERGNLINSEANCDKFVLALN